MNAAASWDTPAYRRIVSASHRGNKLHVQFEDGAWETVDADRVLPPGTRNPDWAALTFDSEEIVVPAQEGEVDIPWTTIRTLTDKDFATHLADVAAEQARQIGLRIRELREQRDLSSKELAERAGITPQSLSRIEHGHHDAVFTTRQRILVAMGCSLKDLVVDPPKPTSLRTVLKRLEKVGIDSEFACRRLIAECPSLDERTDKPVDEELAAKAVQAANGSVERLKPAVQLVAQKESIPVDVLANYLAFRLSLQGINWWGAATALQPPESSPWQTARDMLLERIDLSRLPTRDRELLKLAVAG